MGVANLGLFYIAPILRLIFYQNIVFFFFFLSPLPLSPLSLRVKVRPPLTKEFMQSVKSLPASYNAQSRSAYLDFLSIYGTHYLRQVNLGGHVQSTTAVRTCKISTQGLSVQDVSNCLSAEASVMIKGVRVQGQTSYCKSKGKNLKHKNSFSASFSERVTEVLGGNGGSADLLFSPDKQHGFSKWMKTLKTVPGVVSFRLRSLHMLVNKDLVRKKALRNAIRDYVMKNAMASSCSSKCKVGHRNNDCTCKCRGHQNINSNCCPSHLGVATLSIEVKRATGLWGDYLSKTDGYVKVIYGTRAETTPVIWNNNFPVWNYRVRFGTVNLVQRK